MAEMTLVACRAQAMGEIQYTISIYSSESGYMCFWECQQCHDEGGSETGFRSRDEAIAYCSKAIEQHHVTEHGQ